jgi:hypothetical protein
MTGTHMRGRTHMMRIERFFSAIATLASLAACSHGNTMAQQSETAAQGAPTPFIATATIKDLMDSTVDPSADALWGSVAVVYSMSGEQERRPRTPEEWQAVRRHAITLIEATRGDESSPHRGPARRASRHAARRGRAFSAADRATHRL